MGSEVPGIALCGFLAQPETEERELWGVAVIWKQKKPALGLASLALRIAFAVDGILRAPFRTPIPF